MSRVDELIEREKTMANSDFIERYDFGHRFFGLEQGIDKLTDDNVRAWENFHDRWDIMDRSEKDAWLALLALKRL